MNFKIKVTNVNALHKIVAESKGQRPIVAAGLLKLTEEGKRETTRDELVALCAPAIEQLPKGTVQGGPYVTRYYVSDFKKGELLTTEKIAEVKAQPAAQPEGKKAEKKSHKAA